MHTLKVFRAILVIITSFLAMPLEALTPEQIPIVPCTINRTDRCKGEVALCGIFRDEADYLVE